MSEGSNSFSLKEENSKLLLIQIYITYISLHLIYC